MAVVIDLTVMLEERRRMLDQVDQAIADVRNSFQPGNRSDGNGNFGYLSQSRGKGLGAEPK